VNHANAHADEEWQIEDSFRRNRPFRSEESSVQYVSEYNGETKTTQKESGAETYTDVGVQVAPNEYHTMCYEDNDVM
jgi:hypothetical protein